MAPRFASTRLIARDVRALAAFYEDVTGIAAEWLAPQFAEIVTTAGTLALGDASTVRLFGEGSAEPGANRTAILEFRVEDVDREFDRLRDRVTVVQAPTTMPWGNRSLLLRDPEGSLVNLYAPVTEAARARFDRR